MDCRSFFQWAAGGSAVAFQANAAERAAAASAAVNGRTPEDVAADEDYWAEIRNAFSIDRNVINLNNGYCSPAPRPVQDAMRRYLEYSDMGPYHTMVNVLYPQMEAGAAPPGAIAGCDPEEIAITRNSSESLENAQYGIDLKPGDEVLTTNQDYPRMIETFQPARAPRRHRAQDDFLPRAHPQHGRSLSPLRAGGDPRTKLILICHITNRTGQIFPVRRICDMAHARGIPVMVDGAHAFSHFPFKISDLDCDYYGVSLHKWTYAPIGTGFLYVRKSRIAVDLVADGVGRQAEERHPKVRGDRHASRGQPNAISEALVFNENIGIDRKAARLRYLRDRWAHRLAENPKCRILHSPDPAQSCGIGFLAFNGIDPGKMAAALVNEVRHLHRHDRPRRIHRPAHHPQHLHDPERDRRLRRRGGEGSESGLSRTAGQNGW